MKQKTNIPKQLQEDSKLFPRHIVDENKKDVALMYDYDNRPEIKQEIIERYNEYESVKTERDVLLLYSLAVTLLALGYALFESLML